MSTETTCLFIFYYFGQQNDWKEYQSLMWDHLGCRSKSFEYCVNWKSELLWLKNYNFMQMNDDIYLRGNGYSHHFLPGKQLLWLPVLHWNRCLLWQERICPAWRECFSCQIIPLLAWEAKNILGWVATTMYTILMRWAAILKLTVYVSSWKIYFHWLYVCTSKC